MALRRSAIERIGPFDELLGGAGDEEDWQRRLRAAGGRVGYVAAAGVDHRRAGRTRSCARWPAPQYFRGRASRRYDVHKGTAPHARRPSCARSPAASGTSSGAAAASGSTLTAASWGRVLETLDPAPAPPSATDPDYLSGRSGTLGRRTALVGAAKDLRARASGAARPARARAARRAAAPVRRVHVVGVARPEHLRTVARLRRELARSRHDVDLHLVPPAPGAGKWANVNAALLATPPAGADWLLIVDDDVVLPRGFLDRFVAAAEAFGLELAQPAHAFASHAAWDVTRRRPGVLARRTRFVEIGPVTALSARAAAELLPFPDLRMGWGLDGAWSAARGRARLADRRRRRHAGPPPAPGRGLLPARRRDRRGRGVPRRPRVRDPRRGGGDARGVPRAAMKVVVVAEYYPRARRPRARGVGAPPGARRARRGRGGRGARPAPPGAVEGRAALAATRKASSRRCGSR